MSSVINSDIKQQLRRQVYVTVGTCDTTGHTCGKEMGRYYSSLGLALNLLTASNSIWL